MKNTRCLLVIMIMLTGCQSHRAVDIARRAAQLADGPERAAAAAILDQALAGLARGDIAAARKQAVNCLERYPAMARAHLLLGDLFELEGNKPLAFVEHMAFCDLARNRIPSHWRRYLRAKVAGNDLAGPPSREIRARGLARISRALHLWHSGKRLPAWNILKNVFGKSPNFGLAALAAGLVALQQGRERQARPLLLSAAAVNSYLAEFILATDVVRQLPDLPEQMHQLLVERYRRNRADSQLALLLAVIDLRAGRARPVLELLRQALTWSEEDVRLLLVGAAAALDLGRELLLADILHKLVRKADSLALLLQPGEIPFFGGLVAGSLDKLVVDKLAPEISPPLRQYFLWVFWQGRDDRRGGDFRREFYRLLASEFPGLGLKAADCQRVVRPRSASVAEFHGKVRQLLEATVPVLRQCDCSRRRHRAEPSGRLSYSISIGSTGGVIHAAVQGNTSGDDWLAACQLAILRSLCFPVPLLAQETFSMVVTVGPEVEDASECHK